MSKQIQPDWASCFVIVSEAHWDGLLRFAHGLLKNKNDAEDVVQNALFKATRSFERFCATQFQITHPVEAQEKLTQTESAQAHLRNWLYKIVRHAAYDEYDAVELVEFENDDEKAASEYVEEGINVSSPLQFEEKFYKLALDDDWHKKLQDLTPKQRTVLFLSAESYSYKEIADIMGIPIGTVMSNLSRALEKLKKSQ